MDRIPKYIAISNEVISQIESGKLQPGDKMSSENELIANYGISNTTARKVLSYIESHGWVKKIKGKGTFVINRSKDMHLNRILGSFDAMKESFRNNLIKEGLTPKDILLEKTVLNDGISVNINNKNYVIEGKVLKLHRLRYANDILMKDEIKYISMNICPDIHIIEMKDSLINLYEKVYKVKLKDIQRTITTKIVYGDDQDNYFRNESPLSVFILGSVASNDKSETIEIEYSLYRGDKYSFTIHTKPDLIG
ncbi:GntR family transcriptional regulator [Proteiniphilum sp. X52]|uniref:GntR family transcriptional regulator n=1 Tax=Proteiniphilum sp. X52 TaxID=2382159 RepID=UPI000F09B6F7|nr:GntR family transcriptional regulator [Proteiniphilum sp. X52]RNC64485.1 GntR family transcriptional regulator [Proteiniphilum sp. X52]